VPLGSFLALRLSLTSWRIVVWVKSSVISDDLFSSADMVELVNVQELLNLFSCLNILKKPHFHAFKLLGDTLKVLLC